MSSAVLDKYDVENARACIHLFGCRIDNLSAEEAVDRVEAFIKTGVTHCYFAINVHKIVAFRHSPELCAIANRSELVTADGQLIVWVSKWLRRPIKQRITGTDLMEQLIQLAAVKQFRVYLLGARPEVVARVAERYRQRFPTLQIAGYRHGYWSADEESGVVQAIRDARPDMLFLGMSSPGKELFMERNRKALQVPFMMGVGGSFDVVAGVTRRAPKWMQHGGLEWFWRVLQEPRRMWKRYLFDGIQFSWILARELVTRKDSA